MASSPLIRPREPRPATAAELQALDKAYRQLLRVGMPTGNPHPMASSTSWHWFQEHEVEDTLLQWLIFQDHVQHWQPAAGPRGQPLQRVASVHFNETSSFVLTKACAAWAALAGRGSEARAGSGLEARALIRLGRLAPCYSPGERILRWGQHVVKTFRQPASSQDLLLRSAEEQDWPETWMDDPLPRQPKINPKDHLHDTLGNLNRHQKEPFVYFIGDGTGTRFSWELR
jgi:hypothetical protein